MFEAKRTENEVSKNSGVWLFEIQSKYKGQVKVATSGATWTKEEEIVVPRSNNQTPSLSGHCAVPTFYVIFVSLHLCPLLSLQFTHLPYPSLIILTYAFVVINSILKFD